MIFDYDRLVFEGKRIESKAIVKTVRRLEAIVRNGIARYDEGGILWRRLATHVARPFALTQRPSGRQSSAVSGLAAESCPVAAT